MKSRLNLTIEEEHLMKIKRYAASRKTSVSRLVEEYFVGLTRRSSKRTRNPIKKGLIELIESFPKPKIPKGDLIQLYYQQRKKKYGFQSFR